MNLRAELAAIRDRHHENDDGEPGIVCPVDHYPTPLNCSCGHGHNRHVGQPSRVRCMSYYQQPDCSCTAFVPAPLSIRTLWESHARLIAVLQTVAEANDRYMRGAVTARVLSIDIHASLDALTQKESKSMSTATRYRKKTIVIEAIRFDGTNTSEIRDWTGGAFQDVHVDDRAEDPEIIAQVWDELHSTWVGVKLGQWIIRGVRGEHYPYDAEVFAETYEPEEGEDSEPEPTPEPVTPDTADRLTAMTAAHRSLRAENRALRATIAHIQALSGELLEILDTDTPAPDTQATV